jgi:Domain of unknown function (DUF6473)
MTFHETGAGALDYFPCRYGKSKILFRGPRKRLEGTFAAALGGTETYGKFVTDPWPVLLEREIGMPVVNFGCMNAGVDLFVSDPILAEACTAARLTFVQLVGAQNMTNRFYAVHPRRNDRFLRASTLMKALFAEIDFTEFHFTRHMLSRLKQRAPDKFLMVEAELKAAWVARMQQLLGRIPGRKVLVWLTDYSPATAPSDALGGEPLLIDANMVAEVAKAANAVVRIDPSLPARAAGTEGMFFADMDEVMAGNMPGPKVHAEIAAAVGPVARTLL